MLGSLKAIEWEHFVFGSRDLYRPLRLSWRFVRITLFVAICVFPALAYYVLLKPPVFEARSLILFALGREYIYVPDAIGTGSKAPNPGDFQGVVNAEMLLLDNPELSREALEAVGIDRVYPGLPDSEDAIRQAVLWFQESTTVELITGSYVVKVTVRHLEPDLAAELTNKLTEAFLDRRQKLYTAREAASLQIRLQAATSQEIEINSEISQLLDGLDPLFIATDLEKTSEDQANLSRLMRESRTTLAALEARRDLYATRLGVEERLLMTELATREEQARLDYIERSMVENREKMKRLSKLMPALRPLTELRRQQAERIAGLKLRLRDSQALSGADIQGNVRVIEAAVSPLRSSSASLEVQLAIVGIVSLLAGMSTAGLSALLRSTEPIAGHSINLTDGQISGVEQTDQPQTTGKRRSEFSRRRAAM